jgi:hypothetical protein|tara:strand:+ start:222 stop:392 length:171 start_codon:yes stop_codon:yes gene_type:complete
LVLVAVVVLVVEMALLDLVVVVVVSPVQALLALEFPVAQALLAEVVVCPALVVLVL